MIFTHSKFNQFCLGVSLAVWAFGGLSGLVCAHEYEDGFVERSLTITIRDGVGYGEYQIGLNANTASQVLVLADRLRQQVALAQGSPHQPTLVGETVSTEAGAAKAGAAKARTAEAETGKVLPPQTMRSQGATLQGEVPNPKGGAAGVGEHLTDLATIKRFGEMQKHWFAERLKLERNGKPITLSKVSVEPAARHPFSVVVKFQFSVIAKLAIERDGKVNRKNEAMAISEPNSPQSGVVDFQVIDELFSEHAGATRYALRARGSTMLLQSNVAPVLVRADRVEIERGVEVPKDGRPPAIQAKIVVGRQQ